MSLFDDNIGDKPIIPNCQSENSVNLLKSNGIESELDKETISNVMITDRNSMELPNYVIDFREVKSTKEYQVNALNNLLDEDGDTSVYLLLSNGIEKIGNGDSEKLQRLLEVGIRSLFSNKCKVYRNFEIGKPVHELKIADISSVVLDI